MKSLAVAVIFFAILLFTGNVFASKPVDFTQEDRDRIIRIETTLQVFMQQTDKRFEQVDKRFESMQNQMDKRFESMQNQMDKRFEQLTSFLWMIVSIFTTLVVAILGFAIWDRRTIISRAKEEALEAVRAESKLDDILKAMRRISEVDSNWKTVLSQLNLL
jgi:predicted PurR-regulated permease PerM